MSKSFVAMSVCSKAQVEISLCSRAAAVCEKVSALKKEGKSWAEAIAAKPTADYDAKWGGFVIDGKNFTSLVYQGV